MEENQNPAIRWFEEWSARTPLITRYILQTLVASVLLMLFIPQMALYLTNIPAFVVYRLEIWRLLLSPLVQPSFFSLIWLAMMVPRLLIQLERAIGSAAMLATVVIISMTINTIFVFVCLIMTINPFGPDPTYMVQEASGFWMIMLCLLVHQCEQNPDAPMRSLVCPNGIPARLCPWLLFAVGTLLGGFQLDNFLSLVVGYLYTLGVLKPLEPSVLQIQQLEAGWMSSLAGKPGFIMQANARGLEATEGDEPDPERGSMAGATAPMATTTSGGALSQQRSDTSQGPFAGAGHTLGSTSSAFRSGSSKPSTNEARREALAKAALARTQQQQ